eukprot:4716813-Amphidinium_carterae.1
MKQITVPIGVALPQHGKLARQELAPALGIMTRRFMSLSGMEDCSLHLMSRACEISLLPNS